MTTVTANIIRRTLHQDVNMYNAKIVNLSYRVADDRFNATVSKSYEIVIGTLDVPNNIFPSAQDAIDHFEAATIVEIIDGLNTAYEDFDFDFVFGSIIEIDLQITLEKFLNLETICSDLLTRVASLESALSASS